MSAIILREGEYAPGYIPITSNVFDIPERLKELDERFFVVFNRQTQRYEVHVTGQQGGTLGCVIPYYLALDARTVEYVREHMAARTEAIAEEIERYNEKLERDTMAAHMDKAAYKMKNAIKYADAHSDAEAVPKELINE